MSDVFSMAENNVVGWVLINPVGVLPRVRPILSPGDFLQDEARALYMAACELEDLGGSLDCITIQKRAGEDGTPVPGAWVEAVMQGVPQSSDVTESAQIVHDEAIDRMAAGIGTELAFRRITAEEAVEQLQNVIAGRRSTLPTAVETMQGFYSRLFDADTVPQLPTGFPSLDGVLGGGIVPGGLVTLAARTSVGKTSVALAIATNVARAGGKVLYISLEMTTEQINTRRLAAVTGFSTEYISNRQFLRNDEESRRIARGVSILSEEQIVVCDQNCKLSDIEKHIRAELPLSLVIVDHMGIIISDGHGESFYYSATVKAHRLKQIAKGTGVPILMQAQLNRGGMQRDDKSPRLSDLRDSGAIEEDSDAVILLSRNAGDPQEITVDVAKNRHGKIGTVKLTFVGACCQVTDPAARLIDTDEEVPFDG